MIHDKNKYCNAQRFWRFQLFGNPHLGKVIIFSNPIFCDILIFALNKLLRYLIITFYENLFFSRIEAAIRYLFNILNISYFYICKFLDILKHITNTIIFKCPKTYRQSGNVECLTLSYVCFQCNEDNSHMVILQVWCAITGTSLASCN